MDNKLRIYESNVGKHSSESNIEKDMLVTGGKVCTEIWDTMVMDLTGLI